MYQCSLPAALSLQRRTPADGGAASGPRFYHHRLQARLNDLSLRHRFAGECMPHPVLHPRFGSKPLPFPTVLCVSTPTLSSYGPALVVLLNFLQCLETFPSGSRLSVSHPRLPVDPALYVICNVLFIIYICSALKLCFEPSFSISTWISNKTSFTSLTLRLQYSAPTLTGSGFFILS